MFRIDHWVHDNCELFLSGLGKRKLSHFAFQFLSHSWDVCEIVTGQDVPVLHLLHKWSTIGLQYKLIITNTSDRKASGQDLLPPYCPALHG